MKPCPRSCPHCGWPHKESTIALPTNAIAANALAEVCRVFDLREADVMGTSQTRRLSEARQVVYALMRIRTSMSYQEIGDAFGGRDHSTILYGVHAVTARAERDPLFRQIVLANWPMLMPTTPATP